MTFSLGSTPRSLVKYNDKSIAAITDIAASAKDDMVLIKTLTASSSATLDFVDGTDDVVLDNTYPIYVFKFINIHPATNNVQFLVNFRDGSTAYDATKTTTFFTASIMEDDSDAELAYITGDDIAQGTGFQELTRGTGNGNDECCSGYLHLFNPSSTTFVKHFICEIVEVGGGNAQLKNNFIAGYINTTSAIDEVQLKFSSGNIDSGTIKLYGVT